MNEKLMLNVSYVPLLVFVVLWELGTCDANVSVVWSANSKDEDDTRDNYK